MTVFKWLIGLILICTFGPAYAEKTTIAVASNFAQPLKKLVAIFEQETGHEVNLSIGSTGKIYAQIINGAPFDVFFAADQERPRRLIQASIAVENSRYTYATGILVLWTPIAKTYGADTPQHLLPKIAIANPKIAPYGRAARQMMTKMNMLEKFNGRIVRAENVALAYQYVASGAVQMGFVALSQVMGQPQDSYIILPSADYTPIKQDVVLLNHGRNNLAATAFLKFVGSEKVRDMMAGFGYK